ncbi:glycosyltransferase [Agromyces protaetiae]|nr:glycosyltransferase [Agromyces protaetiae]
MSAAEAGRPTVSVVIPSYRRLERVPPLVAAYLAQGADEVVVVLDGPHPGWRTALADVASEASVVIELPENRGLALARIAGLEAASGDVVLAVDDDVEPGDGLVERHRAFHAGGGDRVLLGYMPVSLPVRRGRDDAPAFVYARDYERQAAVWRSADASSPESPVSPESSSLVLGSLWGGNFSLPRDLYLRAEALAPSIRLDYNEDLDLGIRLERLGATARFDPLARAAHHQVRDLAGFRREAVQRGAAVADLERRWGTRPPQLVPVVTIPASYHGALARGQRRIAASDRPELVERTAVAVYRVAGVLHVWRLQDGVVRFLRRGLAMRGYRQRTRAARDGATGGADAPVPAPSATRPLVEERRVSGPVASTRRRCGTRR